MNALIRLHGAALQLAFKRLLLSPMNSLLSLLVIALALALPTGGWLVLDNLHEMSGKTSGVQQISLFMTLDATKTELGDIEAKLGALNLHNWRFVSKETALKQFQTSDDLTDFVAGLSKNPLPDAFILEPKESAPEALDALAKTLSGWPKIAHVQLDSAWIKRFDAFLRIGKLAISLLGGLFAAVLITATFNTIRLQIMAQAAEIEVARLIGATDSFIRRPFQYFGALQGAFGGLFAALLVSGGGYLLSAPVAELVVLYGSQFSPHGLSPLNLAVLVASGALLGWLGAQISVSTHLFQNA